MDEFLKDREYEFETYAMVSYFKLLKQLELTKEEGFPVFKLIGGMETMIRLEESIENGFFDVQKTNGQLLESLSSHANRLGHDVTSVKTLFVEDAIDASLTIKEFAPDIDLNKSAYTTLNEFLVGFPSDVTFPFIMKVSDDSNKQKKSGQK